MEISVLTLLILFFAHWFADFVQQTDEMAINKSTSLKALLWHVTIYTSWLVVCLSAGNFIFGVTMVTWQFALFNFGAHFVTDFFTSRITSYYWKNGNRHAFFVTIGADQFLHAAALILSWAIFVL